MRSSEDTVAKWALKIYVVGERAADVRGKCRRADTALRDKEEGETR